jgi:hypothetical protein
MECTMVLIALWHLDLEAVCALPLQQPLQSLSWVQLAADSYMLRKASAAILACGQLC